MKVGVCEANPELRPGSPAWNDLCEMVRRAKPDLFLLNEMPFGPWIAAAPEFDGRIWRNTCEFHSHGVIRLQELGASAVAGSRARELDDKRVNEAFVWTAASGAVGALNKNNSSVSRR